MFVFRVLRKRFGTIAGALAIVLACVASASAEVLVSEGCDLTSDYAGAKSISDKGTNLIDSFPKAFTESVGLAGTKWSGWGDKPKAYSASLPLPSSFADVGLTSKGGACVGMTRGTASTDHRWGYLALADGKLNLAAGSTFYFRGLVNVDSNAAKVLTQTSDAVGSGNSFGFGLSTMPAAATTGSDGKPMTAPNGIGFYYWRNKSGAYNLSAHMTDASSKSTDVLIVSGLSAPSNEGVLAENTFICFAEVTVGALADGREVVRVGAVRVSEYDRTAIVWSEPVAIELVADNAHPTHLYFTGDYATTGCAMFDEFVVATKVTDIIDVAMPAGVPVLSGACVETSAAGFSAAAALSNAGADDCGVLAFDGQTYTKLSSGALSVGGNVEKSFTTGDLAADKTSAIYVYAENAAGAATNFVGVIYGGSPAISTVSNADESGRTPGSFSVSRADSAYDLIVNYTVGGTAIAGTNYEALQGFVTVPAGKKSVVVNVRPIVSAPHDADTQLAVTLAPGAYAMDEPIPSASILIANLAPPVGTNTWVALSDGNASDAANWSLGRVPVYTDDILLDGMFSTANLTWDGATGGMTNTVASWTQLSSYTGVVTMNQTRTGTFTNFVVTGNAALSGGSWTHPSNGGEKTAAKVWLNLEVGGDLTTDSGFAFNVDLKGYGKQRGLASPGANGGATHGGQGGPSDPATQQYGTGTCYGDFKNPVSLGSGGYNVNNEFGGGAVRLLVVGDFIHNGVITSCGDNANANGTAGGSVWIVAKSLSGSGTIRANGGGSNNNNNKGGGGGGRVAIRLADASSTYDSFTNAFSGVVSAYGGKGLNNKNTQRPGAAGTVYIETAGDSGVGRMIVCNDATSFAAITAWTLYGAAQVFDGVTWSLAELTMRDHGRVGIKSGGTIHVPSFDKITGDGTAQSLLRFEDGGTLESDIRHDKLVADGFGVENYGTSSFADYALVIPATSSLKVAGDFTVGSLKINGDTLAAGDYSAATLHETYENVSGDGTIHVAGMQVGLMVIVR